MEPNRMNRNGSLFTLMRLVNKVVGFFNQQDLQKNCEAHFDFWH